MQSDLILDYLKLEEQTLEKYKVILNAIWPIIWASAILPLVFIESSYFSMSKGKRIELRRIGYSKESGITIALCLAILFTLGYMSEEYNIKKDLSYLKTTRPSSSTKRMLRSLTARLDVFLFYPKVNEVKEELISYFKELTKEFKNLRLKSYDQVIELKKAQKYQVTRNGTLVLAQGKRSEKYYVGLRLQEAKEALSKLDMNFQKLFLKVTRGEEVAYFTTGHKERDYESNGEIRASLKLLSQFLKLQNYTIKHLGIAEGLASDIPEDATIVFIIGPQKQFLKEEIDALSRYLLKGGRLFIMLDPEYETGLTDFLEQFGLKFYPSILSNEQYFVRKTFTKRDYYNLFTNRFSSHPSVTTLSRNSRRLVSIFLSSGYLEKIKPKKIKKASVHFTVRTMPFTWEDKNQNFQFDSDEHKKIYNIGAAITFPIGEKKEEKEARIIVLADSDLASDQIIRNVGNLYLLADGIKWLASEEEFVGEISQEEDIKIIHTREEDVIWFYSTIFVIPLSIIGFGVGYTKWRKKKAKK
jgi:hypothetical protein